MWFSVHPKYAQGLSAARKSHGDIALYNWAVVKRLAGLLNVSTSAVLRWVRLFLLKKYTKNLSRERPLSLSLTRCGISWVQKNKLWIWKAYCRDTGQLIDWECEDRDQATFAGFMKRLARWMSGFTVPNEWKVYPQTIREDRLFRAKAELSLLSVTMVAKGIGLYASGENPS